MRRTLVSALAACTDDSLRPGIRRFLLGLSSDELQFIADFLGACILEARDRCRCSREQLAARVAEFQHARTNGTRLDCRDLDHKMILLLEYLSLGEIREVAVPVRAGNAS